MVVKPFWEGVIFSSPFVPSHGTNGPHTMRGGDILGDHAHGPARHGPLPPRWGDPSTGPYNPPALASHVPTVMARFSHMQGLCSCNLRAIVASAAG